MRDAASLLLLLVLSLAWSGGNLVLAFASGAGHAPEHLVASGAPTEPVGPEASLGEGQLAGAVSQAKADWLGVRPSADLSSVSFAIADLPGLTLGAQGGNSVTIDADAAGWGWQAMDLTTVVRHEIGHFLGLGHGGGLMGSSLAPGSSHAVSSEYAEPEAADTPPTDAAPSTPQSEPGTGSTTTADSPAPDSSTSAESTETGPSTDPGAPAGGAEPDPQPVEPMTMPERVSVPGSPGLSTSGLGTMSLSTGSLGLLAESMTMTSETSNFGILATGPTTGDDVITIVPTGGGSYEIMVGTDVVGTVSGTDTFTLDGLGGLDVLIGPDVPASGGSPASTPVLSSSWVARRSPSRTSRASPVRPPAPTSSASTTRPASPVQSTIGRVSSP